MCVYIYIYIYLYIYIYIYMYACARRALPQPLAPRPTDAHTYVYHPTC